MQRAYLSTNSLPTVSDSRSKYHSHRTSFLTETGITSSAKTMSSYLAQTMEPEIQSHLMRIRVLTDTITMEIPMSMMMILIVPTVVNFRSTSSKRTNLARVRRTSISSLVGRLTISSALTTNAQVSPLNNTMVILLRSMPSSQGLLGMVNLALTLSMSLPMTDNSD